ncbi:MAG: tetratricopeptide repeat protein [Lentimicrobiaceae bacterium]|nr:tetratricopeptide repeat protein [Lentimicrobiaceae bacterium]
MKFLSGFYRKFLVFLCFLFLAAGLSAASGKKEEAHGQKAGSNGAMPAWLGQADSARLAGNMVYADSLVCAVICDPEIIYDKAALLLAYNYYFEYFYKPGNDEFFLTFSENAAENVKWLKDDALSLRTYVNLASMYRERFQLDKALEFSYKSLSLAERMDGNTGRIESYLLIGQSLEALNRKVEAFQHYLNALSLVKQSGDKDQLLKTYNRLAQFYNINKIYEKAVEYKLRQIDLLRQPEVVDSTALMEAYYDLETFGFYNKGRLNEEALLRIIRFAEAKGNQPLLESGLSLFRSYLIQIDDVPRLYRFYVEEQPAYFESLRTENPLTYVRVKALFAEYQAEYDAAHTFYHQADSLMQIQGNKVLRSHFYLRYSDFLKRQNQLPAAIDKAYLALMAAREASNLDYVDKAGLRLEELYKETGDFAKALAYAVLVRDTRDSLRELARSEELLMIEVGNAEKIKEIEEEKLREETRRRNNIQYSAIVVIIIILFLVLVMLASLRVPKWSIQALGFFSFIFFFEFIILIADYQIHHLTHGEPWKILGIKIVLIAFLLPFHHWIEHKVVSYLIRKRLINLSEFSLRRIWAKIRHKLARHEESMPPDKEVSSSPHTSAG